jgi:hypothetical protein
MRFNNRSLALMDIPDLPINAFEHIGDRKIKPQGGGGGFLNSINGPVSTLLNQNATTGLGGIPLNAGAVANTIEPVVASPSTTPRFLPSAPITPGEPAAGASQIDASIRPFLTEGLRQAQEVFLRQQPQMFQGQTYVSPSEQTLSALQSQENIARGPAPTLQAAQGAFLRGLTEQSAAAPMYQNIYGAAGYQPGAQTF